MNMILTNHSSSGNSFYHRNCSAAYRGLATKSDVPFWRLDEPTYIPREKGPPKLLKGGMWPSQRAWWEAECKIRVIVGGFGSGKTWMLCKRMISLALENAPVECATVSPAYTMAVKTIVPTMKALLAGKQTLLGSRAFWWRYTANPIPMFVIRYHGRIGTIWCLSSDRPLSLRGTNLAAAGIDEPFIQPKSVYTEMIARVRHPHAKRHEICIAGTPEQLNWGYDLCVGDLGEGIAIEVIQLSTRENKILDPQFVKDLESSMSEKAIAAYVDGKFINLSEGQVYYSFDPHEHVVELPIPENAELGCGMDFNVNPMSAVLFWRAGSHMHVFKEIELANADTESMAIELRRQWPTLENIYPDATGKARKTSASGKTDFSILKKYGYTILAPAGNPPIRDRENTVNGKMKPAAGKISFTISPKCKSLVKSLSVYTHELKNKAEQKRMSHLIDALGYPICRLFPLYRTGVRQVRF